MNILREIESVKNFDDLEGVIESNRTEKLNLIIIKNALLNLTNRKTNEIDYRRIIQLINQIDKLTR